MVVVNNEKRGSQKRKECGRSIVFIKELIHPLTVTGGQGWQGGMGPGFFFLMQLAPSGTREILYLALLDWGCEPVRTGLAKRHFVTVSGPGPQFLQRPLGRPSHVRFTQPSGRRSNYG